MQASRFVVAFPWWITCQTIASLLLAMEDDEGYSMSMTTAAFIGMGAVVLYGLVAFGLAALHHSGKTPDKEKSHHAHID